MNNFKLTSQLLLCNELGTFLKPTHIHKAPSPELWRMWGTFAGTLVNVREVLVNVALWVRQSSPNFARLRQSSHEGARMLPVHPGTCLNEALRVAVPAKCGMQILSETSFENRGRYGKDLVKLGVKRLFSTPNMTGRRFHRIMEMIPALPS